MDGALDRDASDLSSVLDALSDPTRRRIVLQLASTDSCCSSFRALGPKTRLTYHFARLEAAGLVRSARQGTRKILSLRRAEIDAAFPGLLEAVLDGAARRGKGRRDRVHRSWSRIRDEVRSTTGRRGWGPSGIGTMPDTLDRAVEPRGSGGDLVRSQPLAHLHHQLGLDSSALD